ncbi:MAG: class I SAM-dependent methyltransferase [Saccharofermentans sp.]|nr:class I SAM-dependent methyltransferase [Saccharofermentans sp.]
MITRFDVFADDYREIHTNNVMGVSGQDSDYFSEYKIVELKNRGLLKESDLILDFGCGDGNTSKFVKKHFSNVSYYGIDISEESIAVAKKKNGENGTFKLFDGKRAVFEDNSFDVIFMACALHHIKVDQRDSVLKECFRLLKPEGRIIIFEHNPYNPVTINLVNTCPFDSDAVLVSPHKMRKFLKNFDCNYEIRYTIFFPRKGLFLKLVPLEKVLAKIPIGGQYYAVISEK